jgi:hypothetical protein
VPAETARLFPHLAGGVPLERKSRDFLIARLLEEGESADLTWLTSTVPVDELREWVRARGNRQLSRRSLRFWTLVLGVESSAEPGDELWQR